MGVVLYRKYRSQDFDELIGQDHITTILKNAVSRGQIAHAYLFHGPRGLGKTSAARILAKAVNCLQLKPDGNPCDKCKNCLAVRDGKFLDLIEIDAASNRGIDQIRDLKEKIEFSPTEGLYKVYIIDEVHMLTSEAFNALLKTLEEPPSHAMFILCTTEVHKLPATILSRCQRFDFKLATLDDLRALLSNVAKKEKYQVEDTALDLVIENARGSYRDALSLLDVVHGAQKSGKNPGKITADEVRVALGLADSTMAYYFLEKLVNAEPKEALELVQELSSKGVNLSQFVKFVLSVLREILVGRLRGDIDYQEYSFAKKLDRQKALQLINLFVDAERLLKDAVIPTLPLEVLVADAMGIFGGDEPMVVSASTDGESGKSEGTSTSVKRKNTTGVAKTVVEKSTEKRAASEPSFIQKCSVKTSDLEKKWSDVLRELKPFNSHLYAFIGKAKVLELKNGILKLGVAFDFHKDRLESPKSRAAVSKVFEKVFGSPVGLECVVDDNIRANIKSAAAEPVYLEEQAPAESSRVSIYDNVAEVFGGDLVAA